MKRACLAARGTRVSTVPISPVPESATHLRRHQTGIVSIGRETFGTIVAREVDRALAHLDAARFAARNVGLEVSGSCWIARARTYVRSTPGSSVSKVAIAVDRV